MRAPIVRSGPVEMNAINPHLLSSKKFQDISTLNIVKAKRHATIGAEIPGARDELRVKAAALQYRLRADGMVRGKKTDQAVHDPIHPCPIPSLLLQPTWRFPLGLPTTGPLQPVR